MTNKLYVFGSSHTDPKEKDELEPLLRRVGETGGVILAEFENDAYTTSALKRFKELDEKEILTVIEHEGLLYPSYLPKQHLQKYRNA